jgi:hypothetical protein
MDVGIDKLHGERLKPNQLLLDRIDLLPCLGQHRLATCPRVRVQDANFDGFVNFAVGGGHRCLRCRFGFVRRLGCVGIHGSKISLHQSFYGGAVGFVPQTVALSDLGAFLGGFDIGHGGLALLLRYDKDRELFRFIIVARVVGDANDFEDLSEFTS